MQAQPEKRMIIDTNIAYVKRSKTEGCLFSILIPSWNNLPFLKTCVDSIRKNSSFKHQLIVHINDGSDGTLNWVKEQPDIDYVHSDKNIGVCYALNFCRTIAATSYILYINDDMYVCPDWDKYLKLEIDAIGHNYFFLSSTAIEPVASSACVIEYDFGRDIASFDEKKLLANYKDLPMHDWQGATWPPNIVHISVWDMVGGYSTEFSPGMYSDPDFSMKLWKAGIRLFKGISKSRVYHFGSRSVKRVKRNPGYFTFIAKWGVTSSTLTKLYLKRGKKYDGLLSDVVIPLPIRIKNFWKRIVVLFKKY